VADERALALDRYRYVPLRDGMQVIAYFGKIYTYTWMQMGMTGFAVALHENPDLVARVFEQFGRRHLAIFERIVELPDLGAVWIADDMAYAEGMLVNPDVLREHCLPWYRRMGDICRERGLLYIFHSDGGYACGSSNAVTYYVPLANFNAMREAVATFGAYPISL